MSFLRGSQFGWRLFRAAALVGMAGGVASFGFGFYLMDGGPGAQVGQHLVFFGLLVFFALFWGVTVCNGVIASGVARSVADAKR